jgi:hypothetical protein
MCGERLVFLGISDSRQACPRPEIVHNPENSIGSSSSLQEQAMSKKTDPAAVSISFNILDMRLSEKISLCDTRS